MIINKNSPRKIFSELTEIVQVITHLNKKRHYTEDKTEKNKHKLEYKLEYKLESRYIIPLEPNHTIRWEEALEMETEWSEKQKTPRPSFIKNRTK